MDPVGRLVGPRSEDDGTGAVKAKGKDAHKSTQAALNSAGGANGAWTAVGVGSGVLALLGVVAFAVRRRRAHK